MTQADIHIKELFETMEYGVAPESSKEALGWIQSHQGRFGQFINGQFRLDKKAELIASHSPADGQLLAHFEAASDAVVAEAVAAAKDAQSVWALLPGHQRARLLYALARLLQKHIRVLAVLESLDNGKPIRESRDADIPLVIRHFYHYAGWAQLQHSELQGYQPVGVAAQIIPWNFPLLMLAWKVAPAIAMGNTVVLKPAEYTSLTALFFAELCQQAGIPDGVVNIITGAGATGAALALHPDVDKVAFTGSTEVGRQIRRAIAGQGKKLTLELGGKSAFIVFDDADLDSAVEGLVDAIWFNQGEVCCAGSRLLVQAGVAPQMLAKIKQRMAQLRVGNPLDKSIDIGALVDPVQQQRIANLVEQGLADGGELYQLPNSCPVQGCYYPPTLITGVESSHRLAQEEVFGPVLVAMTFRTQAEAVALANNTRYGLAASIWSENINQALDVAPKLSCGVIWINSANQFDAACGFGGVKESGFGREGGREGLYEYLKPAHLQIQQPLPELKPLSNTTTAPVNLTNGIDHTVKFYVGGRQVRPDSGHSYINYNAKGEVAGYVGAGNRKDIRNAVAAALKSAMWNQQSGHLRAQIMYYLAENLAQRQAEWSQRLQEICGVKKAPAIAEVEATINRLFSYAAWADKYDGAVHNAPYRGITLAMHEPVGVMGLVCPERLPLLALVSLLAPAVAMGNRVVLIPSERYALLALDLVQILETSDIPAGVINLVAGNKLVLAEQLAGHAEVDSLWCWGANPNGVLEQAAALNLKRCWTHNENDRNWLDPMQGEGLEFLRQATEVKNIWTPYGD